MESITQKQAKIEISTKKRNPEELRLNWWAGYLGIIY
jgi:hypothetical protein